jgi:hypothetical protein
MSIAKNVHSRSAVQTTMSDNLPDDPARDVLSADAVRENPYQSPAPADGTPATFSLVSLLLVITLFAVCLGLTLVAPGLGLLAFMVATPAFARTWWVRNRRKAAHARMDVGDKIVVFFASTGIVSLIGGGAVAAFCAVCFPIGYVGFALSYGNNHPAGPVLFFGAWISGFVVAGTVMCFLASWMWKWGA